MVASHISSEEMSRPKTIFLRVSDRRVPKTKISIKDDFQVFYLLRKICFSHYVSGF